MHLIRTLKKLVTLFVSLCFVFSIFFVHSISAEEGADSLVDATFDIAFVTGTDLIVDITMDVNKITTDEEFNAEEIANAIPEDMGTIKYELYLLIENQLEGVFLNAEILNFSRPEYDNGQFNEVVNVKLTESFFELNESVNSENLTQIF